MKKPAAPPPPDDNDDNGNFGDLLKGMAMSAAVPHLQQRIDVLSAAIGWAIAHAHDAHDPQWRIELMVRAGWIPPTAPTPKGVDEGFWNGGN